MCKDNLITCKTWKRTKKCRIDCPLRHSEYHELKQRKDTMCYWEDKGGCTKQRCEYKHKDPLKDEWKEVKVKTLSELKSTRNNVEKVDTEIQAEESAVEAKIEVQEEKADTETKVEVSEQGVEAVKYKQEVRASAIETKPKHLVKETVGVAEEVKRVKKPEPLDDLDKELEELDEILNDTD